VLEPLKCPNLVQLFEHMVPDCHSIAAKPRNYSKADEELIETQKFESSQKDESRWQSTDSSKAYRNTSGFK